MSLVEENSGDLLLKEADVRAIVRLLGDVCALPHDHAQKKRHLMDGLCGLVGVDAWAWGLMAEMTPGKLPVSAGMQHGGFGDEPFAEFLKILVHPDMAWLTAPYAKELKEKGHHLTRTMQQIIFPEIFLQSGAGAMWSKLGFFPCCLSSRPREGGGINMIGLYRKSGRPLFHERESRIVHVLLSEIPWLHEHGWPDDRGVRVPSLPVQMRLVLEMLLQSYSRKVIADHMGISIHTVSGYIKEIYRHFLVHSHAELLRRFFQGDGGDKV
jgi:Bacterial regulatory proteins, luxR family